MQGLFLNLESFINHPFDDDYSILKLFERMKKLFLLRFAAFLNMIFSVCVYKSVLLAVIPEVLSRESSVFKVFWIPASAGMAK